ncbi:MAG: lytic transglycosylase domain-containing protein [Kofleriaceae bacterium]|jgi:hypothetical protein|nr:lytic transglycosylase domain-containing protein [Kofleriaceae bacterium]
MANDDDGLTTGALLLGGGLAGYAIGHWLIARRADAAPAPPTLAIAATTSTAAPSRSPPPLDEPVSSPSQVDAAPTSLSREFDPIFERYRGAIPIEYLRALAKRESSMKPGERSGPAWGLMQVVEVVRGDYNQAHGTRYARIDLLDPAVNVAMACWVLRFIIESYQRNHPDVPNLRADWDNPRFVELLTFGWNAGFSEKAGVGCVARYLEKLGTTDVTLDQVHDHARLAGASRHLSKDAKVRWCKGVVALYQRERSARRNGATVTETDDGRMRVTGSADYVDIWIALKGYFGDKRGVDVAGTANTRKTPRTTNADVLQLTKIWDQTAARARTDIFGVKGAKADWEALSAEVKQATAGADATAIYADNFKFWKVSKRLAIVTQVAAEEPPDITFMDALEDNIKKLPGRIVGAGEWLVDGVTDVASGAADVAGDAASGAGKIVARGLGPLMKPIAIGAGVLGAGFLLVHVMDKRSGRGR